jgi:aminocarboxymuconate-semialdehyde decarboxylase
MPRQLTQDVIRFQNDFNASVQEAHPDKFTTGFVVQAAYIDDALKEMDRCVNELGLSMLCLPTHFQNTDGQWKSIASRSVKEIFELADQMGLAIEIHPYDAPKIIALEDVHWRFHLVWMMAQTADAYHMYTLRGFQEVFSNIRVCFAHGNQFGQMNTGRRLQGYLGRPDLFEEAQDPSRALKAKNLYFDTLLHDLDSLLLLIKRQGVSQVLAGMDDPYPLGEMEHVGGGYPGKLLDTAVEQDLISKADKDRIWYDNVIEWLFGANKEGFFKRTGLEYDGAK